MLLVVVALLVYNLLVWHFCTRQLLTRDDGIYTGDLARMSYLSGYTQPRKNEDDLPRRHLTYADYVQQPIDVVTLGDSFSQGGGMGENRYYQDYIATSRDRDVLNVTPFLPGCNGQIEAVAVYLNSGFFDQIKPNHLILQMVERNMYKISGPTDFSKTMPLDELEAILQTRTGPVGVDGSDLPPTSFLNSGNAKWLFYNLLYLVSENAFVSKVQKVDLDRPLFSGDKEDELLFLYKDLNKFKKKKYPMTADRVASLNANLNQLAKMLRQQGITLYFMPVVDKHSLYSPYISDNPFPEHGFFELLREAPREYRLIDTHAVLRKELDMGIQDVYWRDDTHWSWKASEALFFGAILRSAINKKKFIPGPFTRVFRFMGRDVSITKFIQVLVYCRNIRFS